MTQTSNTASLRCATPSLWCSSGRRYSCLRSNLPCAHAHVIFTTHAPTPPARLFLLLYIALCSVSLPSVCLPPSPTLLVLPAHPLYYSYPHYNMPFSSLCPALPRATHPAYAAAIICSIHTPPVHLFVHLFLVVLRAIRIPA